MDVKQAIFQAKNHVRNIFEEESPVNVALEEVEFDNDTNDWLITIGFSRTFGNSMNTISAIADLNDPRRSYKVVRISDQTGDVRSVKNHETAH